MTELNRKRQPGIRLIDRLEFKDPEITHLSNGIPVYIINSGTQDVVKTDIIFRAGSWYESKPLIAKYTHKMLREGSRNLASQQIAETIDYFGAFLDSSNDFDFTSITLYTLSKYFSELIALMEEIIKYPVFPSKEFEVLNSKQRQKFLIKNQKVKFIARQKFLEMLFGRDHPYGRPLMISDYDNIQPDDLRIFHKAHFNAGSCFILISGKVTDEMKNRLNDHFGSNEWNGNPHPDESDFKHVSSDEKSYFVEKEAAIQSAIRIGKVMFNKKHEDYHKLKILNTIIGGYFGSRLMTSIREEKGYTYGIGSGLASMQRSGYFFIASEVGSEVVKEAVQEVIRELEIITTTPVPEKELNLVKNYILGSFQRSLDGPFALSDSIRSLTEYGLTNNYYREYFDLIKSVTPADLLETAQKHLDPGSFTVLTVGSKNHN